MDRKLQFTGALRSALAAAALIAWLPSTASQSLLPAFVAGTRAEKPANAPAAPLPEQLAEARGQLDRAVQARSQADAAERQDQPLQADKLRLLDWLVDLQRDKVKRLDELTALQAAPRSAVEANELVKALQAPPPHSAVEVDALRDEIDGLQEELAAFEASYRANETELQNLHDQLKVRAAAARRTGEASFGARPAEAEKVQGERDVANLREKVAEVETAVLVLDQQRLGLQTAALRQRIDEMQAVVARVLPQQRLSPEDLAAQRQRIHKEEERLAEEIQRIRSRNSRHLAEQAGLGAHPDAAGREAAFLNRAIKIDNAILKGLDHLQMLNGISGDAWEKRYTLLAGAAPEQQRVAIDALAELRQKLADWRSLSHTRQDALRTEIRAQRVRVDNLSANRPEQTRENELLDLLQQQTAIDERVELAAARLEKQVSRWLDDVAGSGRHHVDGRLGGLADGAAALAARVWQQELFVVEDASEVDGRQVSVKYGVTVGKSIGLLAVFVVGYWLLAMISRFIQHQLVRWFKISPQLASVIRRWAMIGLSFALVVLLLNLARIPLSVFAFAGGALAIGVGFGAQTVIKNFISGLIVLFERKVRVGDIVELGGVTGHVAAVDLRATTVRCFDGIEALIPNASFVENQVVNWTYSNKRSRREIKVGVAYGSDLAKVESLFLATAIAHMRVLCDPAPEVFFEDFADSAVMVVLVYWVELDGPVSPRRVASDLRFQIYERLAAAGIAIPFPQREVRLNFAQPAPDRAAELGLGAVHAI